MRITPLGSKLDSRATAGFLNLLHVTTSFHARTPAPTDT